MVGAISEIVRPERIVTPDSVKDGGPAFPIVGEIKDGWPMKAAPVLSAGMTLRDYFAIHADQPGRTEIAALAGVRVKGVGAKWEDPDVPHWEDWWSGLSSEERFSLYARVRYAIADAMLKERSK